jgi:hypothetical protein
MMPFFSRTALILAVGLLTTTPAWAEGWLCVAENATGFAYNAERDEWDQTRFSTDEKWVISKFPVPADPSRQVWVWRVMGLGENFVEYRCNDSPSEGWLLCEPTGGGDNAFRFNHKHLRFLRGHMYGYVDAVEKDGERPLTPYIEIGKCTPL